MNIPKIGLDIDGVIADFNMAWHRLYPEINPRPNTWFLDDNIKERFNKMRENGTLDAFYLSIEPLVKPEDIPFEPHCYITSRPVVKEVTEEWLNKHGFPAKPVISIDILTSKVDAAKKVGVEIFIDDFYDNFLDLNNNNVLTYLYSASHNMEYDVGHMRLNSLKELPLFK